MTTKPHGSIRQPPIDLALPHPPPKLQLQINFLPGRSLGGPHQLAGIHMAHLDLLVRDIPV